MIVFGGLGAGNWTNIANGYTYGDGATGDPQANRWRMTKGAGAPSARNPTLVGMGNAMVRFGGWNGGVCFNDAYA